MPHQSSVLEATAEFERCAYYLDMGLGKTFVGAEKLIRLNTNINLLICQKSKIDDWVEHFEKFYTDCWVCNLTNKKMYDSVFAYYQTDPTKYFKRKTVLIINYDLVFRRKELLELTDFTLMLDESSIIQNEGTDRKSVV